MELRSVSYSELLEELRRTKEELRKTKEEYDKIYHTLNVIGEQLLKQIELNKILWRENEILLEQKEAIWQSIQKK